MNLQLATADASSSSSSDASPADVNEVPRPFLFDRYWPVLWPTTLLVLCSLIIRWTGLDLKVSSLFFDRTTRMWPYEIAEPWLSIYRNGTIPSFIVGIAGGLIALTGSWILPACWARHEDQIRRAGLFLVCLLAIGPGLIVNVGFKHLWGRPRPLQCAEFGGDKPFLPVGTWAVEPSRNSSFPSGHAAVAFYLMAPAFIAGRRHMGWMMGFFALGLLYGLGMGLTRVVQGGHFVSDILWAGTMVYLTGVVLARMILRNEAADQYDNSPLKEAVAGVGSSGLT